MCIRDRHIDGCHDEDRVQQALQVGKDAVGLDLVVHDQHEHHDGPRRLGVQVGCGAPQADDADEVAADAQSEDRADEWDIPVSYTHLIDLKTKVDPAVLGGIRLDIEGTELDGTVHSRLSALRRDIASVTL